MQCALTAVEFILGRHGALHDLWFDEAGAESISICGVVLQRWGRPSEPDPLGPISHWLTHCSCLATRGQQRLAHTALSCFVWRGFPISRRVGTPVASHLTPPTPSYWTPTVTPALGLTNILR